MNALETKYWKELIKSMKANQPFNFPMDLPTVLEDKNFLAYVDKVKQLKIEYECTHLLFSGEANLLLKRVLETLKKYQGQRKRDHYDIFKAFYVELDLPLLDATMQQLFTEGIEILENKIDYFCSYTSKGLPEINNTYSNVVSTVFGLDFVNDRDRLCRTNYIAKLIIRYFNEHGFNGFFDQESIVNGDCIKDEVLTYISRTNVLVLLAQQETFRDRPNETNWCFQEYEEYLRTHTGKKYFIVYRIPELTKPLAARQEIQDWYTYVSTPEGIKSETIPNNWSNMRIKSVLDKDAAIILEARESVFYDHLFKIA